jgi:hypothetical protein
MKVKREEGDNYTFAQEEWVAGRTSTQKKMALMSKEVRGFIAKHPGSDSYAIREQLGADHVRCLDWLLKRNLIRFESGPHRQYFVVPL